MTKPTRASELNARAFILLGYGHVSELADALDYPRSRVSKVLNDRETSDPMLTKIEAHLERIEADHAVERKAAA